MRMLSLFPQLLFLAPLSATLIRIALAILLICDAWRLFSSYKDFRHRYTAATGAAVAALLIVGAWTQLVALMVAVTFTIFLVRRYLDRSFNTLPASTIALAIVMALSLVMTGAGAYAVDLPL